MPLNVLHSAVRAFLLLNGRAALDAATRVEAAKQQDCQSNRSKLEAGKVDLMSLQGAKETLSSLSKTERGTEVDESSGSGERPGESSQAIAAEIMTGAPEERSRDNDVDAHGEDLVSESTEKNVVGGGGVSVVRLLLADEAGAGDLGDRGDDVGDDEEPHDELGREDRVLAAETPDEHGENGVDARGEEDGRGDDEEVVENKVDQVVRIFLCREGARAVADDFEDEADGEGAEPPGFVADGLRGVDDQVDGEPGDGEAGEDDGGREAVDDDGNIVGSVGVGEVGVNVAMRTAGLRLLVVSRSWWLGRGNLLGWEG